MFSIKESLVNISSEYEYEKSIDDIINKSSMNEIVQNSHLFMTEENTLMPFLENLIVMGYFNEAELNMVNDKVCRFKTVCIESSLFKTESHSNKYDEILQRLDVSIRNKGILESYTDMMNIVTENLTNQTMGDNFIPSLDKDIVKLCGDKNDINIDSILSKVAFADTTQIKRNLNDLVARAYCLGLINDGSDDFTNIIKERIETIDDLTPEEEQALSYYIDKNKDKYLNLSITDDEARIIESIHSSLSQISKGEPCETNEILETKAMIEMSLMDENMSDEMLENVLNNIYILEGKVARTTIRALGKAEDGVKKGVNVTKGAGRDVKDVANAVGKVPKPLEDEASNFVNKLIKGDKEKRRQKLLNRGIRFRLFRFIKKALTTGTVIALFGPVSGAISSLGMIGTSKYLDNRAKKELIHEMEQELAIVNEKLDDAKSEGDKKNKYKLMRIKDNLETEIQRVKYGVNK